MKAATYQRYGPPGVVTVADIPTPVPAGDQVLVRVGAATVGVVDSLARQGSPRYARLHFGLRRPRFAVLGSDFAGRVAATGPDVTRFAPGDAVFGTTAPRFGAHAQYVCLSERAAIAPAPPGLTDAEAAALADTTATCFLWHKTHLQADQAVLINGASGAVGSVAVQLARQAGASVTGVCGGRSAGLARKLGAQAVINYDNEDFTRGTRAYDVVFDVAGTTSFARCRRVLTPSGTYLTTAPSLAIPFQLLWTARSRGKKAVVAFTGLRQPDHKREDLRRITELVQAGELEPVIEECFPLARIADAYERVDAGHKRGNVIVVMAGNP